MTQEKTEKKSSIKHRLPSLPSLLLFGCATELLYLLIIAIVPLPELHLYSSPLATAWPWTLAPSHLLFPGVWSVTQQNWSHLALLSITILALMGVYALALGSVRHIQTSGKYLRGIEQPSDSPFHFIILAATLVFGLTLLLQPALFSDDVFTYIFSGRILTIYHADPLNTAPIQFLQDPYLQWVISGRNIPNIYGPLWLSIASLLVGLGQGPVMTLLLFKAIALFSHMLNCILLWAILGKIAPSHRLLGTLLYAWNPLALIELAGSGHSEGLLLCLLLLATWLYIRYKGRWCDVGVLVLLGLAININLIVLLIAPLFVWFLVRTERNILYATWAFCWRISICLGLTLIMYIPFWRGASTFLSITSAIDIAHFVHSPAGILIEPAHWFFGLVAQWSNFPPVMQPTTAADVALRASTIFIFALIYIHLFGIVRNTTTTIAGMRYSPEADQQMNLPGFDLLLDSWNSAVFWYLVLVLGWFWPWYVLWTLWVVAMRRFDVYTIAVLLLSGTALLTYPLLDFAYGTLTMYQPILIFGIPLVYLLVNSKRRREQ